MEVQVNNTKYEQQVKCEEAPAESAYPCNIYEKSENEKVEGCNPESMTNIQNKVDELLLLPKISAEELQKKAEEDAQKFEFLDSNLDDLFAKISKLTSEVMEEPKIEHKTSLVELVHEIEEPLAKHSVSMPEIPIANLISYAVRAVEKYVTEVEQVPAIPKPYCLSMSLFQLGRTVGSGKFGYVCQCRHIKTNGLYALKKIFKSTIAEYKIQEHLIEELTILNSLSHPNIIQQYACWTDQYHIFMLLEYVDGVGLLKYLKSGENYCSRIIEQVVRALIYLHNRHIMHRDVKPENILCEYGTVKLCDFGWATSFKDRKSTTFCGTLDYLSPEVALKQEYDKSVDIWSVGILIYELLTGKVPFKDSDKQIHMKNIKYCDTTTICFPEEVSPEARYVILGLLKKYPKDRMTLEQVLEHPFISKYSRVEQPHYEYFGLIEE